MKLKHSLWIVLALVLLAVILTGVLPFCIPRSVSQAFADTLSVSQFYGDEPCVDRVALVETPQEGFDTRIHILDEAASRIDVSYYAMHMGQSTDLFLGALLDAADRGVQVRILVDGQFGGLTASHRDYATAMGSHPNISLKLYNTPNPLKPWTWNGRLHDKYILIDNRLLLLGGRNIGDKYFAPEGCTQVLSYDRDVLVCNTAFEEETEDSVLFDVRAYMDDLWNGKDVREPFSKETKQGIQKREALSQAYRRFRLANESLFDHTRDNYPDWTCEANRVTFLHNDTNIGPKPSNTGYALGQLLRSAQQSVTLQSPYVILNRNLKALIQDLGEMDIDTTILTNSVAVSPNPMACTAYHGSRRAIVNTGVNLWEYQGPNTIHAKSYLIDDRMSVVGSFNLDPRSDSIDTELMLAIDSPDFASRLALVQSGYQSQALPVGRDGRYLPDQALEPVPLSGVKKAMVWVLSPAVWILKGLT